MELSSSYVEMLISGAKGLPADGCRSYPLASLEIMLMDHAQHRAHNREAAVFRQLCLIFDWQLTRLQYNRYQRQLRQGYTLVLTDPDKTILWTSHSFLSMTGYRPAEVVGQKPTLLQGPATQLVTTQRIREKLARAAAVRADLLNYRKDGSPYTCRVCIAPLRNAQGELTHFLAVEREISQEPGSVAGA